VEASDDGLVRFKVLGQAPSKSNTYKIVKQGKFSSLAKTDATKKYEESFFLQCAARNLRLKRFELHVDVYFRSNRSDLDNSLKIVLDCLQSCKAIRNDNGCVKIVARKFIDKENPRVLGILKPV
jgi:Holliday junction resolvase RusA-like endonuclease